MKGRLPPGKVPWEIVADLVSGTLPAEVKLGPAAGEDAALVEIGGELWAVASDPVSFTAADAGRLAVIVNANDVAVRGARPMFFLAVGLIAPHEATEDRVKELLTQVRDTCREIGCNLIGGHTVEDMAVRVEQVCKAGLGVIILKKGLQALMSFESVGDPPETGMTVLKRRYPVHMMQHVDIALDCQPASRKAGGEIIIQPVKTVGHAIGGMLSDC